MNETETRAELIDPKLKEKGWGYSVNILFHNSSGVRKDDTQKGGRGVPRVFYLLMEVLNHESQAVTK
jgi:type I site-specific restriction endonuclease